MNPQHCPSHEKVARAICLFNLFRSLNR